MLETIREYAGERLGRKGQVRGSPTRRRPSAWFASDARYAESVGSTEPCRARDTGSRTSATTCAPPCDGLVTRTNRRGSGVILAIAYAILCRAPGPVSPRGASWLDAALERRLVGIVSRRSRAFRLAAVSPLRLAEFAAGSTSRRSHAQRRLSRSRGRRMIRKPLASIAAQPWVVADGSREETLTRSTQLQREALAVFARDGQRAWRSRQSLGMLAYLVRSRERDLRRARNSRSSDALAHGPRRRRRPAASILRTVDNLGHVLHASQCGFDEAFDSRVREHCVSLSRAHGR